jgi:hypothetical protein
MLNTSMTKGKAKLNIQDSIGLTKIPSSWRIISSLAQWRFPFFVPLSLVSISAHSCDLVSFAIGQICVVSLAEIGSSERYCA